LNTHLATKRYSYVQKEAILPHKAPQTNFSSMIFGVDGEIQRHYFCV